MGEMDLAKQTVILQENLLEAGAEHKHAKSKSKSYPSFMVRFY